MFTWQELSDLPVRTANKYKIIFANGHDITLKSLLTGHEWIIITNYGNRRCRIRHRHSRAVPFHEQKGQYASMGIALDYIEGHDIWYAAKEKARQDYIASRRKAI